MALNLINNISQNYSSIVNLLDGFNWKFVSFMKKDNNKNKKSYGTYVALSGGNIPYFTDTQHS